MVVKQLNHRSSWKAQRWLNSWVIGCDAIVGWKWSPVDLLIVLLLAAGPMAAASVATEDETPPDDWEGRLERLRAVPYVGLSDQPVEEDSSGVVFVDPDRVCDGYFHYCNRLSGDAFLLDVDGQIVHQWQFPADRKEDSEPEVQLDDYTIMLDNGDLLVQKKFMELLQLDWNSNLRWRKRLDVHHDMAVAPDGSYYVVLREFRIHRDLHVRFPAIVHLTAEGEELDRWSGYDRLGELKRSLDDRLFLDTILDSLQAGVKVDGGIRGSIRAAESGQKHYDHFHLNTVGVLPPTALGRQDDRFGPGNLLVCFRNINHIAVLEKDTYRVLWAWGADQLDWPHHPTMLPNGHILIFDNGTKRKYSRVIEINPVEETIVWSYQGDPPKSFFSHTRGSAQRLPNGNTLICESNVGRAFQVTEDGTLVWEWLNPRTKQWRGKTHRETVYRMLYYSNELVEKLLLQ
jgi:hypothetical protein